MESKVIHYDCPAALDVGPFFPKTSAGADRHAERIELWKSRMGGILAPRCAVSQSGIDVVDDIGGSVKLESGVQFSSLSLARGFAHCDEAAVFVVTVGPGPDDEAKRLSDAGELIDAYIVESLASAATDAVMRQFIADFEADIKSKGRSIAGCFSPGSCDFPIEEQRNIFAAVDAASIGVELSESFLMTPRKSVSGILGLLPFDNGSRALDSTGCAHCDREDCFVRDYKARK